MTTPDDVISYLTEVDFPAGKDAILQSAEQQGAPPEVLKALRALPPVEYGNKTEVGRSAGVDPAAGTPPGVAAERSRDKGHQRVAEHERNSRT
jgi:hypothetical protein